MKTSKEVEIGKRYTCKIRGRDAVCRVKGIDTRPYARHSTVRIIVVDEATGKQAIFRSPSRLIARLGERFVEVVHISGRMKELLPGLKKGDRI